VLVCDPGRDLGSCYGDSVYGAGPAEPGCDWGQFAEGHHALSVL